MFIFFITYLFFFIIKLLNNCIFIFFTLSTFETQLTGCNNYGSDSLLSFLNSSSKLVLFTFYLTSRTYIANIEADANLIISKGLINQNYIGKSIVSSGHVELEYISVISYLPFETLCFFKNSELSNCDNYLILTNSSFYNLRLIRSNKNTFVSSGMCNNEKIIDCLFANITSIFDYKGYNYKVKKKNEEESVKVDYCFLKGTRMFKVEGNFYGGIVTGVTEKTKKVFMCNNCSFVDNFRERGVERILKYNNNNYFVNNSLKSSNVLKFNSFDTKSEKRKIETSGGDCIFYHSSFTNCIADGQGDNANLPLEGGAIYMVNSNYAKFESCIFDSCSSTGNGGGIYLNNVGH